jgi:hypothetical protein
VFRLRVPDEETARRLLEALVCQSGRFCPRCGCIETRSIRGSRPGLYECRVCRRQFTATTRTPLHGTKLPIRRWLEAIYLTFMSSKGIFSVVLARQFIRRSGIFVVTGLPGDTSTIRQAEIARLRRLLSRSRRHLHIPMALRGPDGCVSHRRTAYRPQKSAPFLLTWSLPAACFIPTTTPLSGSSVSPLPATKPLFILPTNLHVTTSM